MVLPVNGSFNPTTQVNFLNLGYMIEDAKKLHHDHGNEKKVLERLADIAKVVIEKGIIEKFKEICQQKQADPDLFFEALAKELYVLHKVKDLKVLALISDSSKKQQFEEMYQKGENKKLLDKASRLLGEEKYFEAFHTLKLAPISSKRDQLIDDYIKLTAKFSHLDLSMYALSLPFFNSNTKEERARFIFEKACENNLDGLASAAFSYIENRGFGAAFIRNLIKKGKIEKAQEYSREFFPSMEEEVIRVKGYLLSLDYKALSSEDRSKEEKAYVFTLMVKEYLKKDLHEEAMKIIYQIHISSEFDEAFNLILEYYDSQNNFIGVKELYWHVYKNVDKNSFPFPKYYQKLLDRNQPRKAYELCACLPFEPSKPRDELFIKIVELALVKKEFGLVSEVLDANFFNPDARVDCAISALLLVLDNPESKWVAIFLNHLKDKDKTKIKQLLKKLMEHEKFEKALWVCKYHCPEMQLYCRTRTQVAYKLWSVAESSALRGLDDPEKSEILYLIFSYHFTKGSDHEANRIALAISEPAYLEKALKKLHRFNLNFDKSSGHKRRMDRTTVNPKDMVNYINNNRFYEAATFIQKLNSDSLSNVIDLIFKECSKIQIIPLLEKIVIESVHDDICIRLFQWFITKNVERAESIALRIRDETKRAIALSQLPKQAEELKNKTTASLVAKQKSEIIPAEFERIEELFKSRNIKDAFFLASKLKDRDLALVFLFDKLMMSNQPDFATDIAGDMGELAQSESFKKIALFYLKQNKAFLPIRYINEIKIEGIREEAWDNYIEHYQKKGICDEVQDAFQKMGPSLASKLKNKYFDKLKKNEPVAKSFKEDPWAIAMQIERLSHGTDQEKDLEEAIRMSMEY